MGKVHFFQAELQAGGTVFDSGAIGVSGVSGKVVDEELVIPDGVSAPINLNSGVVQPDIVQLCLVFEEPPVGDVDFYGAGIEQCVIAFIQDQCVMDQHFVEEGKFDAFYPDSGVEVMGKPGRHPRYQPVLDRGQLDKHPSGHQ